MTHNILDVRIKMIKKGSVTIMQDKKRQNNVPFSIVDKMGSFLINEFSHSQKSLFFSFSVMRLDIIIFRIDCKKVLFSLFKKGQLQGQPKEKQQEVIFCPNVKNAAERWS